MHEIGREEMIKTVGRRKKKSAAIYLEENQAKGKEDSRANIQGCLMVWSVSRKVREASPMHGRNPFHAPGLSAVIIKKKWNRKW